MSRNMLSPKILLIGNDPAAANAIRAALGAAGSGSFEVEWVRQLSEGLARLRKRGIDAVLLELSLQDSNGIETFEKLFAVAPDVPILILSCDANEALAKQAVARGAQDYLLPRHLDYSLPRTLRNAIERKAIEDALYAENERAQVTRNLHMTAKPTLKEMLFNLLTHFEGQYAENLALKGILTACPCTRWTWQNDRDTFLKDSELMGRVYTIFHPVYDQIDQATDDAAVLGLLSKLPTTGNVN